MSVGVAMLVVIGFLLSMHMADSASGQTGAAKLEAKIDHSKLMVYRDARGVEQPVRTAADWALRRAQILEGAQEAMGRLPASVRSAKGDRSSLPALDVKVIATLEREGYTRLTISFVSEVIGGVEDRVPAFLYLPKASGGGSGGGGNSGGNSGGAKPQAASSMARAPAILALHQTHALGKGDTDVEHGRTNRCFASELAERGYVVLAPDYPSFGDYKIDFANLYKTGGYVSGSMKGIFNHMRAMDVLQSRPEVDGERIGVIGHSLGGHNSIFVAAFDPRIKAIVSSCGWTPFHDYYGGKIAGWTSDRYMPRLRDMYGLDPDRVPFDFYELIAALAPRPFFSNSPVRDDNFDHRGVRKGEAAARQVYRLLGAEKNLAVEYPDSGHDFPPAMREAAYRMFDAALGGGLKR